MTDPTFQVIREGSGIVIKGTVPVSVQRQDPFLEHVPSPNPAERTYRLEYRNALQGETETGCQMQEIEYHDSELAADVLSLRIKLGGDREIVIPNTPETPPEVDPPP